MPRALRIATALLLLSTGAAAQTTLPAVPQDAGLAYTRSAHRVAIDAVRPHIALHAGARHAVVRGYRVRLDDADTRAEAIHRDGDLLVPEAFAVLVSRGGIDPLPAPDSLKDRWVYSFPADASATLPDRVPVVGVAGRRYVSVAALARALDLTLVSDGRGLFVLGRGDVTLPGGTLRDAVVTLFDSPEKFADPAIHTKHVPLAARQGDWTTHVKVTPEQLAMLNGPETEWPLTPVEKYDDTGFDRAVLGSAVPPPGEYPRVLFSAADLPAIRARIRSGTLGLRSWIERDHLLSKSFWDPTTSDGQVFAKLASGDLTGLEWPETREWGSASDIPHVFKGQKPGIYNSHIAYVPEALTNMALQCLLEGDEARGKLVARAVANYYRLREPLIDEWNAISDSEFGSQFTRPDGKPATTGGNGATWHWRGMHGIVGNMNLGLALDFSGAYMTPDDKAFMQRLVAKATYGRRAFGQDGPLRFRDVNWVSWDLPQHLALLSIEGLPGCDTEALEENRRTIRAFLEWGIDPAGVLFESNGKAPGGLQSLLLSMVAESRRGPNLFGHPHFRNLLTAQILMTSPTGRVFVNSGTAYVPYSRETLSPGFVMQLKRFFPSDRRPDYLLSALFSDGRQAPPHGDAGMYRIDPAFSEADYRASLAKAQRLRMPSPTYPGFVRSFLYDADYAPTSRADLNLPLTFDAPVHGTFSAYSDRTSDAAWINLLVRSNHYLGAGHHHADAGMIHFSALGVDWITESPFSQAYAGNYHNLVRIDGRSQTGDLAGNGTAYQAAATYLGATMTDGAAFASADLTNSYAYAWQTQPGQTWPDDARVWELDPSPALARFFAGTARYKMRPWWMTANYSNYIATSRTPYNPVRHAFRTAGLVRGERPYAVVIDDLRKDDTARAYEWAASLNGGVWRAEVSGVPAGQLVLAFRPPAKPEGPDLLSPEPAPAITPAPGQPLLLVAAITPEGVVPVEAVRDQGPPDRQGRTQYYDRLRLALTGQEARFRILLLPFRAGEPLPTVTADGDRITVRAGQQIDTLTLTPDPQGRTRIAASRAGASLGASR